VEVQKLWKKIKAILFSYGFKNMMGLPCVFVENCKTWATSAHIVKSTLVDSIQPAEDYIDLTCHRILKIIVK
jgi:hypothetical protein